MVGAMCLKIATEAETSMDHASNEMRKRKAE